MKHTLVELAQAMLIAAKLPEFLWEPAVKHAAYVCNCTYTSTIECTPYHMWHGHKPDMSHLREFGTPVWTLLQGQKTQQKLLPKSVQQTYVRHEDGSGSIKYYNPETRKILLSRNYHFLSTPLSEQQPKLITITPNAAHKGGESRHAFIRDTELTEGLTAQEDKMERERQTCLKWKAETNPEL
jgi:hypothetical protein